MAAFVNVSPGPCIRVLLELSQLGCTFPSSRVTDGEHGPTAVADLRAAGAHAVIHGYHELEAALAALEEEGV